MQRSERKKCAFLRISMDVCLSSFIGRCRPNVLRLTLRVGWRLLFVEWEVVGVIGKVLVFLRKRLDGYLRAELAGAGDDPVADKVVFVDGDKMEPISFQEGAVSELLINVEEERLLRAADPFVRVQEDGKPQRKQPDLRLVFYMLFVARFKQYDMAWDHLTKVIEYLQSNRTFEREVNPELPAGIDKLTFELMTQSFAEQNDIWNALRTTYHPSALYRVRLVVLQDVKPILEAQITKPIVVNLHRVL